MISLRGVLVASAAAALSVLAVTPASPAVGGRERPRVGVLFWHDSPNDRVAFEGVRQGFALAGRDPIFEVVEARGDDSAARVALRDFEARRVDLVYALGTGAALRARDEVKETPVVFTAVTDPVGSGVVGSSDGSRRNLCGTATGVNPGDTLRVFRAALPDLRRLGVVHDPGNPVSRGEVAAMKEAARSLDPPVELVIRERAAADLAEPGVLGREVALALKGTDALWIPIDIAVYGRAGEAAEAAAAAKRPVFATAPAASRTAAAVSVTVDFHALGRRSVVLAMAALRGEDPGKIPVLRPRSYRVILNLEASRRSGFEIPLALLASADEFAGVAGGR